MQNISAKKHTYVCIDLKSYYASVECVARGLDPLKTNLVVADESRSDKTICLAVSPCLKQLGIPGRPRLFEAKQKIREYERTHHTKIPYIVAVPRMAEYERVSALIYAIYLKYAAAEDIHVYSIDECFIDVTAYLHFYTAGAEKEGVSPAHLMTITMIREVLRTTGITATAGIGTNLYLAKVAMDIVAKKAPADSDGVRIAELDEMSYRQLLWDHQPLTDFWQIGAGKMRRLNKFGMFTMREIAAMSYYDEEFFYKVFGIDGEILIDHAWGIEPVTMADIKNYHSSSNSLSSGQVLPRPYHFAEARLVFAEMIDGLCADLCAKSLTTRCLSFWVSYDPLSLEAVPDYSGPLCVDFYGRLYPGHTVGTVRFDNRTDSHARISEALLAVFDLKCDHRLLIRRLGVCAADTIKGSGVIQLDFFTDYESLQKEHDLQNALYQIRSRYGANAVVRAMNLLEGGTAMARNMQIGGHKA